MKFVFSPNVLLCGWLGSKHQVTNKQTLAGYNPSTVRTVLVPLGLGFAFSALFSFCHVQKNLAPVSKVYELSLPCL